MDLWLDTLHLVLPYQTLNDSQVYDALPLLVFLFCCNNRTAVAPPWPFRRFWFTLAMYVEQQRSFSQKHNIIPDCRVYYYGNVGLCNKEAWKRPTFTKNMTVSPFYPTRAMTGRSLMSCCQGTKHKESSMDALVMIRGRWYQEFQLWMEGCANEQQYGHSPPTHWLLVFRVWWLLTCRCWQQNHHSMDE